MALIPHELITIIVGCSHTDIAALCSRRRPGLDANRNRVVRPNQSSLISATSQGVHASTSLGATLDTLSRKDCRRVVFNSSFELTPQSYANHQWLQSVRVFANGSAWGLVHNEFKPELSGAP